MHLRKNLSLLMVLVFLLPQLFSTFTYSKTFTHPGILNSQDNLKRLHKNFVENKISSKALSTLLDNKFADINRPYTPYAVVKVESHVSNNYEKAFRGDAHAARANALLWVMTGKKQYLVNAKRILNDWAETFQTIKVVKGNSAQAYLEAAWALPIWISAAEIIRYYDNAKGKWSEGRVKQFDKFVLKLHAFSKKAKKPNNWGASASLGDVAVGVYLNNDAIFDEGVTSFKHYLKTLSTEDGALTSDYLRDTWHPQYTLIAWTQTAEIAWHQGIDLYGLRFKGEEQPRLKVVLEHFSKLFIGELANPEGLKKGNYKNANANRPGYQIAFNHYFRRLNKAEQTEAFKTMVQTWYPGDFNDLFMSWDGITHR